MAEEKLFEIEDLGITKKEETTSKSNVGIEKVRKRKIERFHKIAEILQKHNISINNQMREDLENLALEYADLENDFDYISETSSFVAKRYAEVFACLPTLQEINLLLEQVNKADEKAELFTQNTKEERLALLTKLRSAIKASQTGA